MASSPDGDTVMLAFEGLTGVTGVTGGSIYALDEAQGTRPKSRRGRGMRSREGAPLGSIEPQMGDDEVVLCLRLSGA